MVAFKYRVGTSYPVSAQEAGERIEALERENGSVTAEMVVDDARPEDALLHPVFEWDDKVAGEKWRRYEARELMGDIVTVVTAPSEKPDGDRDITVRAFSNINPNRYGRGEYKTTTVAIADPIQGEIILRNAKREMEIFLEKYRNLTELREILETAMKGLG